MAQRHEPTAIGCSGMTEHEAIEVLEEVKELDDSMYQYNTGYLKALDMAIRALSEIPQYRAIGTVEEIEPYVRLGEKFNLCDLVRENARLAKKIQLLEVNEKELKEYKEIGTVEECQKAMEGLKLAEKAIRRLLARWSCKYSSSCQFCIHEENEEAMCHRFCGSVSWCFENAKWNGRLE